MIKKINFKDKRNTRPLGNHEEELRAEDVNHIKEVINHNAEDQKQVNELVKRHKEDDNLHVTPQEKKDWGEKYSLVVNTAANEIILFKGGKEISKAIIEVPEPDNLGDHTATQNLDMAGHRIVNLSKIEPSKGSTLQILGYLNVQGINTGYIQARSSVTCSTAVMTGTSGVMIGGNTAARGSGGSGFKIGATGANKVVFGLRNSDYAFLLDVSGITSKRSLTVQDKDGTVAHLDDIKIEVLDHLGNSQFLTNEISFGPSFSFDANNKKVLLAGATPWMDLTLSSGARASRAKYKINMRTVMFDVYSLEIPKTRPFTIFNMPEHLRPEKDRYIGGVVRLTTYETYSLIVKRNGNVMIHFPMEKLRNDKFSFTVEYTLD